MDVVYGNAIYNAAALLSRVHRIRTVDSAEGVVGCWICRKGRGYEKLAAVTVLIVQGNVITREVGHTDERTDSWVFRAYVLELAIEIGNGATSKVIKLAVNDIYRCRYP